MIHLVNITTGGKRPPEDDDTIVGIMGTNCLQSIDTYSRCLTRIEH